MPLDHPRQGVQQVAPGGKFIRIAEPPILVVFQLGPALVFIVVRQPESLRIGHMNRHRHAELPAGFPNRIQLRIVHADEFALFVAQIQAKLFKFLETGGAQPVAFLDLVRRAFGKIRLVPAGVIEIHVMNEPSREEAVGELFVALEFGQFARLVSDGSPA